MISIAASGVAGWPSPRTLESLRRSFAKDHFVRLPGLLHPSLRRHILAKVEALEFSRVKEERPRVISVERPRNRSLELMLTFLIQHPRFVEFVQAVTGCPPINSCTGRIFRMRPGRGHYLNWHADSAYDPGRLVSLSLNLSRAPFEGGRLQLRERGKRLVAREVANTRFGDAVLFPATEDVLHRNTTVTGRRPKTAFAGFYAHGKKGQYTPFGRRVPKR